MLATTVAVIVLGTSAFGESPRPRVSVPENATAPFRVVGQRFTVTGADSRYVPITDNPGISCVADPAGMGAMRIHYLNPAILFDGVIDPDQPEAVVMRPPPNGSLHLVALEYIVKKAAWDAVHRQRPSCSRATRST
jgi:hypothetical protein